MTPLELAKQIKGKFGHLISGFFSRSEILMSIALPRLLHLNRELDVAEEI